MLYGESIEYAMNRKGLSTFETDYENRKYRRLWSQDIQIIKNLLLNSSNSSVIEFAIYVLENDFDGALSNLDADFIF